MVGLPMNIRFLTGQKDGNEGDTQRETHSNRTESSKRVKMGIKSGPKTGFRIRKYFLATTLLEVHLAWITRMTRALTRLSTQRLLTIHVTMMIMMNSFQARKNCFKELMKCYSSLETMAIKNRREKIIKIF